MYPQHPVRRRQPTHKRAAGPQRFLLPTLLAACSSVSAEQLTVDVLGLARSGGHVRIAVYDDATAWEDGTQAVATGHDSVTGPTVRVGFADLAPGRYAVRLFHDENDNGRLDANMLGIPVESYGFSGDRGRSGVPSFDDAAFDLRGDLTITISLQ